ncbi:MAG TPA: molybdate ABC transporter substrate-binding protein, partial [Hyphomicrobiaceae bacterium]|nr:molybdate ABC transporter substrate-binding protein [Hyphomicrobiaceae bacterium]
SRLAGLAEALDTRAIHRFAIANPEHAPYGERAKAALMAAGVWEAAQKRLVLGDTVSQAAQFVVSGAAEAGLVALSLVRSPMLEGRVSSAVVDDGLAAPLRQTAVTLARARAPARAFAAYIDSEPARQVLDRFGFGRGA